MSMSEKDRTVSRPGQARNKFCAAPRAGQAAGGGARWSAANTAGRIQRRTGYRPRPIHAIVEKYRVRSRARTEIL